MKRKNRTLDFVRNGNKEKGAPIATEPKEGNTDNNNGITAQVTATEPGEGDTDNNNDITAQATAPLTLLPGENTDTATDFRYWY